MLNAHGTSRMLWLALAVAGVGSAATHANAQPLRYAWQAGQKFSYDVDVTVDEDEATTTYKGVINYTVDAASAEQMRLSYRGGLAESKKAKQARRGRGRLAMPFGPPYIPSPFARPTFAGKTQTTNRITITDRGNVLAMEGDSQLPYLLGNVSLLPFEALPAGSERGWFVDTGVSVTEEEENRRGRFGPFDPFAGNKTVQAGAEVTRYAIQNVSGDLVTVKRSYTLTTPATDDDNPAFEMTGSGTWTFDRKENIPHALDMKYSLTVKVGNSTTEIPITVKYTRVSAEELARREAIAKQAAEQRERAAAAAKAEAEAPLTSDEKRDALNALTTGGSEAIEAMLKQLAAKTPKDPDADLVAAIERHLNSDNKAVASAAHATLLNWSPDYNLRKSLAKAYQGPGVLKSTGLSVESITPLYVGQIVQAQRRNRGDFWFAAEVQELQADGMVKLGFLTWGKVTESEIVARRNIQLAPKELEQPKQPPSLATAGNQSRTWTDASGRFKMDAVFVGVTDGHVNLKRADNRLVRVPLEKLSAADRAFIQQLQKEDNPFQVVP